MTDSAVRRIRLVLQYDGSAFFGWQSQADSRTVQGELERVVSRLFDRDTRVVGAGRTDRGVHATGQVAAVDAPAGWPPHALRRSMNALLPADVWVAGSYLAAPDFHPRFQASARSYEYRLGTSEEAASPFHARWCWRLREVPDLETLRRAASGLLGDHSFRSFAKAGQEERGDRCVVTEADFTPWELGLRFRITANRFLHHMVRYLVGTLVAIGTGERPAGDLDQLLAGSTRLKTSPPAPAHGLYLTHVEYATELLEPQSEAYTPSWPTIDTRTP